MEDEFFYLKEDFDFQKLKKLELVSIINRHSTDSDQVSMALTKSELVYEFNTRIIRRRAQLLEEFQAVIPTGNNIEDAETRGRPSKSSSNALSSVHLSPKGPRTRSRSRSPVRSAPSPTKRRPRREALKEAIAENPELEGQVASEAKRPALTAAAAPAKSPTKPKKELSTAQIMLQKSESLKQEAPKKEKEAVKREKELLKSPSKSRKSKIVKDVKGEEESNFSNDNLFQQPSSTDFKRKRRSDADDAAEERPARRREVAPHKHKQDPPQSLPVNAQDVFSHPPDLQAPANLSHEPFDVSYGEGNDANDNFVDEVLQMPDPENVIDALTSTPAPAHAPGTSWLPSLNQIQQKVSAAVGAVENVAEEATAFTEVMDGDFARSSSVEQEEREDDERPETASAEAKEGGEKGEHTPWYKLNIPKVKIPKPHLPELQHVPKLRLPALPKPTIPPIAWRKIAVNSLKYSSLFAGSLITISLILFGSYLLLWVRDQKLAIGYCTSLNQRSVSYPAFLEADLDGHHHILQQAQEQALGVFESCAPVCTKCPKNAKCTTYDAVCLETFVKEWPLLSYVGVPLAPRCVKDPVKLYKLKELKKRATAILNQLRADYECRGTKQIALNEEQLKEQLRSKRSQGVDDELFEELFAKVRSDFEQGDVDYPEIQVTRQVEIIPVVDDELTMTPSPEQKETLYFSSTSLVYVSFWCRLKLAARDFTHEHQKELQKIVCILFIVILAVLRFTQLYLRHARRQGVYETWIKVLKELREDADSDPTGQQTGWSAAHILLRQADPKDRQYLEKLIDDNTNVRVREVEQAGEMVRAWEWVP